MARQKQSAPEHGHTHGPGHDHARESGGGAGHGHGAPFVWDPDEARRVKARRLVWAGAALIVLGAVLLWLARASSSQPAPTSEPEQESTR